MLKAALKIGQVLNLIFTFTLYSTNVKCCTENWTSSQSDFHFHLIFDEYIRFNTFINLFEFMIITFSFGAWGSVVIKALRY
jgi:hypothetical protein